MFSTILKYLLPACSLITLPSSLPSKFIVFDKELKLGFILYPFSVSNYKTTRRIKYYRCQFIEIYILKIGMRSVNQY